jgi:iron-sulfur cluster insertion protein
MPYYYIMEEIAIASIKMSIYPLHNITNNDPRSLSITEAALARLKMLLPQESADKGTTQRLRLRIDGGGCSGFQYVFSFDGKIETDDLVFKVEEIEVVIDEASLELVAGSHIDYAEDLMSATFVVKNPNATASCGCGSSFSVF